MNNKLSSSQKMPTLDPIIRCNSFDEVATGYTEKMALEEAARCLNCKNKPCVLGCPVNIDIPNFINKLSNKDFDGAYEVICQSSCLPSICSRVCPQETQCQQKCVRGLAGDSVSIGNLERFVADRGRFFCDKKAPEPVPQNCHKVAVVGSGPAGISCAGELCKKGYSVTVFEALHAVGGVLSYGIPKFRLPENVVSSEVNLLKQQGVKFELNCVIGKTFSLDDLFGFGFERIFIASGAGLPKFMGIPGENLNGVFSANEFLTRVNLMKAYSENSDTPVFFAKNVAVVGGGNVAIDAARCAKRLGAKNVQVLYRRSEDELPARKEEIDHAKEEGVRFNFLVTPVKIIGNEDKFVDCVECVKMQLDDKKNNGRRSSSAILGSNHTITADCVIMAIGTSPNPILKNATPSLDVNAGGGIIVNSDTGLTSITNVYAGGDAVTGSATVILAMAAGKRAASAIERSF